MIGIIPAAGKAERMHGLPKFMLPIQGSLLYECMARNMQNSGVKTVVMGTRQEFARLIDARVIATGVRTVYARDVGYTETMSETVLRLRPRDEYVEQDVLFGMPDAYVEDEQAFVKLAACLDSGADVAVGVFHAREGQHTEGGMVHFYAGLDAVNGNEWNIVRQIVDKPAELQQWKEPNWIWGVLAWKPEFWQHIHAEDAHVGFGVQRAVEAGMDVRAVKMDGGFWDCGTPERYFKLINHLTQGG